MSSGLEKEKLVRFYYGLARLEQPKKKLKHLNSLLIEMVIYTLAVVISKELLLPMLQLQHLKLKLLFFVVLMRSLANQP